MNLKLVKGDIKYKEQIIEMLDEWVEFNKQDGTNHSPYAIFKNAYNDFDYYLENLETKEHSNGLVPDSTFFLLDEQRHIILGAVNIRHYLNENLLRCGGHIGDGIRPSERRKGFATEIIRLALIECKKLGLERVLIICDKDNIGSSKSIQKNGGILENEVLEEGKQIQRYWINV